MISAYVVIFTFNISDIIYDTFTKTEIANKKSNRTRLLSVSGDTTADDLGDISRSLDSFISNLSLTVRDTVNWQFSSGDWKRRTGIKRTKMQGWIMSEWRNANTKYKCVIQTQHETKKNTYTQQQSNETQNYEMSIQESCAIAKMTAQCALYMVPWKFSWLFDYAHGYYSQPFSWAFVPIHPMNVPSKFEIRSFTRSWNNRRYPQKTALPFLTNF